MELKDQAKELIEYLYLKYHKELFSSAFKLVRNESDAEDLISEVFYIATLKIDTLLNHPNKIAWLYKVLHLCVRKLKVIDSYRKCYKDNDGKKHEKYIFSKFVSYDEIQHLVAQINLYEGELFEDYKDILTETEIRYLIYKFEFGLNVDEISKLLNKSKTATTTFGSKIKKKLKKFIYEK